MDAVRKQGSRPQHDCLHDGHVEQFMSTRCAYCHEVVRDLSVDENHIKHGEFFA